MRAPPTPIKRRLDFRRQLLHWYHVNARDLPWRTTRDPYRIWVSEVMLQQTQVNTVIPYFNSFVERYPDIAALAEASQEDVLKEWEKMGYYARARNLHRAARQVATEMNGVIPTDPVSFRRLPGVGEYIASAVMSIAFDEPCAVVDGNVKRVLSRLFLIDAPVNHSSSARNFKDRAEELLDRDHPGEFNQAMMELGATICTPKAPGCDACPVRSFCGACLGGEQNRYPVRQKSRPTPTYHVAVGVIRKDGRILITRRKASGLLGGLWEFPGGKIRPGESPEEACRREIEEEVSLSVEVSDLITHVDHAYSHFKIAVDVFDCRYKAGDVALNGPTDYRWILLEETSRYPFPALNHKIFPYLERQED